MKNSHLSSCFTEEELRRYSRNMLLKEVGEEGQQRLKNGKVLLVGAGGLASPAALYLAACGIGTIGIVDFDTVDLSNLNRQVVHGTDDVGRLKVESAQESVTRINPHITVVPFPDRIDPGNAIDRVKGFDIVIDACDNLATKFLLNDACYMSGKPYIFGGAVAFDGQTAVFWPQKEGPCLRCLFPKPPPAHLVPSCNDVGVLGPVPGLIGIMQATEAVKLLLGAGTPIIGKFFIYNPLTLTMHFIQTAKNPDCPLCGLTPSIKGLTEGYDGGTD